MTLNRLAQIGEYRRLDEPLEASSERRPMNWRIPRERFMLHTTSFAMFMI
jgi:hypothetical protein